jgi:hypothetical protein
VSDLTPARLRELFKYDPETGLFTRRISVKGHPAGTIATRKMSAGYIEIGVDGRKYLAHRLAFLFVNGNWPPEQVDHINRQRTDNRWANLRLASISENHANKAASPANKSGFKGVCWRPKQRKWTAQIKKHRRIYHLGCFDSPSAAHQAYIDAASELFGEFARAT